MPSSCHGTLYFSGFARGVSKCTQKGALGCFMAKQNDPSFQVCCTSDTYINTKPQAMMTEHMGDDTLVEIPKLHFASVLYGATVGFLFIAAGFGPFADNFCRKELMASPAIPDLEKLMGPKGGIVAWNQAMASIIVFSGVFSMVWRLVMTSRRFENLSVHSLQFKKTSLLFWVVHVVIYLGFSIWGAILVFGDKLPIECQDTDNVLDTVPYILLVAHTWMAIYLLASFAVVGTVVATIYYGFWNKQ